MSDLYYPLKHAFERSTAHPPDCRARIKSGPLQDQIRYAMFKETLLCHINEKEIKKAVREGLLIEQKIKPDGRTVRNIYVWTDYECKQVSTWKKSISSIKSFFIYVKESLLNLFGVN
ncbi:MAG: hypothetical protein H7836_04335 [Magnetococcus sp. YQC-3]